MESNPIVAKIPQQRPNCGLVRFGGSNARSDVEFLVPRSGFAFQRVETYFLFRLALVLTRAPCGAVSEWKGSQFNDRFGVASYYAAVESNA